MRQRPGDGYWEIDCGVVAGSSKRLRYTRKTYQEAHALAATLRTQRTQFGAAAAKLTPEQFIDAAAAYDTLTKHGSKITLLECVTAHIVDRDPSTPNEECQSLQHAIVARIADMESGNRRARSIQSAESRLRRFMGATGDRFLPHITAAAVTAALDDLGATNPVTRKGYIADLRAFFTFCIKRGWIHKSPMEGITMPKVDHKAIEFMRAGDVERFLHSFAHRYPKQSYIAAIGFFTGMRTSELMQIHNGCYSQAGLSIAVTSQMAKTRQQRFIPMSGNLIQWWKVNDATDLYAAKLGFEICRRSVCASLKLDWPANCMRHTFATYHYAMHQNAALTCAQMGNSHDVMMTHYRGLASREEAEKFWSIVPPAGG